PAVENDMLLQLTFSDLAPQLVFRRASAHHLASARTAGGKQNRHRRDQIETPLLRLPKATDVPKAEWLSFVRHDVTGRGPNAAADADNALVRQAAAEPHGRRH